MKAEAIADAIDRNAGSVRNRMQSLKTLDLVAGVPGPAGEYKPTETAFAVLGRDDLKTARRSRSRRTSSACR